MLLILTPLLAVALILFVLIVKIHKTISSNPNFDTNSFFNYQHPPFHNNVSNSYRNVTGREASLNMDVIHISNTKSFPVNSSHSHESSSSNLNSCDENLSTLSNTDLNKVCMHGFSCMQSECLDECLSPKGLSLLPFIYEK